MTILNASKKTLQFLIMLGASILLGFLSFAGFYSLFPILPLAIAAFFLATIYESQVFLDNIKNTWKKLKNYKEHTKTTYLILAFSLTAGALMTLGATLLLQEGIALIGFLAPLGASPVGIIILALIIGIAYAHITFNSFSTLIENKTLTKWLEAIKKAWRTRHIKDLAYIISSIMLMALAIALTVCTAGTWSTIAQKTKSLLNLPKVLVAIIHPIIISFATIIFNTQNTYESLELITKTKLPKNLGALIKDAYHKENLLQFINPFRIILKLTLTPLRIIFFLLHLVSIGVTADRLPKVPQIVSALLGIISEAFEDLHYFADAASTEEKDSHSCEAHGHSHKNDIPTIVLNLIFAPIKFLAALWETGACKLVKKPVDLKNTLKANFAFENNLFFKHSHKHIIENLPDTHDHNPPPATETTKHKAKSHHGCQCPHHTQEPVAPTLLSITPH